MNNLLDEIVAFQRRVQDVRETLQWARLELEALDRKVVELARQELHHGA